MGMYVKAPGKEEWELITSDNGGYECMESGCANVLMTRESQCQSSPIYDAERHRGRELSESRGTPTLLIGGIVGGAVVLLAAIIGFVVVRRRNRESGDAGEEESFRSLLNASAIYSVFCSDNSLSGWDIVPGTTLSGFSARLQIREGSVTPNKWRPAHFRLFGRILFFRVICESALLSVEY
jgi:Mn2+/Fe2+ NRAMP family transporter